MNTSIPMAKAYYNEFKRQQADLPESQRLKIATIFSYGANEEEIDGILSEENPESTTQLDQQSRDFLDGAIRDYNQMFSTNYDTSSDRFQNHYKDLSLRMKNRQVDLLLVVNMFLTGFDETTLNTLFVDKNLKGQRNLSPRPHKLYRRVSVASVQLYCLAVGSAYYVDASLRGGEPSA